jgi:hypothetical protein
MATLRMRDPLFEGTKVEENVFCRVHSLQALMSHECGTAYGDADQFWVSQIRSRHASNMEWLSDADETDVEICTDIC